MSIFLISIMASNARLATAGFGSAMAAVRARGVICHDSPHLSLHQPHSLSRYLQRRRIQSRPLREEIEPRPNRHDPRRVDVGMTHIVVALDVVDIHRLSHIRYPVEFPQ